MPEPSIRIDLAGQTLTLVDADGSESSYPVSTSKYGAGEVEGSFKTPRGRHRIHAKIGDGAVPGTVFVGRQPTGEIYSDELAAREPGRDWILTRILWLEGQEPGKNQHGNVDTLGRYIYIHGMPDSATCGEPGSIGCIRMRNDDIIDLFDRVAVGTVVTIG
ncbi:MAG: L,D-transpeptidase [Gammaproteobacteria bacterium]|nr:L,D-transpeptidase [Gammaproteobacteria bacterium]